jgi:hypothetical protein
LEKLRASLVLVFSADHCAFRAGVQRVVFFVVLFRVVVLIASLVLVEVAHRDWDNKKPPFPSGSGGYERPWR